MMNDWKCTTVVLSMDRSGTSSQAHSCRNDGDQSLTCFGNSSDFGDSNSEDLLKSNGNGSDHGQDGERLHCCGSDEFCVGMLNKGYVERKVCWKTKGMVGWRMEEEYVGGKEISGEGRGFI